MLVEVDEDQNGTIEIGEFKKMIDKMRETIANQAFLDTRNLSKKQSDHMKNIRLNR